jgi:hypothetical protein
MPLVTASAALLGVYITNLAQERRSRIEFQRSSMLKEQELKREKLEEMYILFQKWEKDVLSLCLNYILVYKGESSTEEAMSFFQKNRLQEKNDPQRLKMLMSLYFPDLEVKFKVVFEERGKVLLYCMPHNEFKSEDLNEFIAAQEIFEVQTNLFKKFISKKRTELCK